MFRNSHSLGTAPAKRKDIQLSARPARTWREAPAGPPPNASLIMKFLLIVPIVAFFGFVPARAEYGCRETVKATHPITADGTIGLWNVNGDVIVHTWDRNEVSIVAEKSARTDEELRLIQLTIDPKPDKLSVSVKLPKRPGALFGGSEIRAHVTLTITVPVTARLEEVQTVNGDVKIERVQGLVHASSVNGGVKGYDLAGEVIASSTNGSVDVGVASVRAGQKIRATTVNGSVTLRLPADVGASVSASVVNGHVDCEFPLQMSGRIGGHSVNGSIGDGGAEVKASSVNGNVRILKRHEK